MYVRGDLIHYVVNSPSLEGKYSEHTPRVVHSAEISRSIFVCHVLQLWSVWRQTLSFRGVSLFVTDRTSWKPKWKQHAKTKTLELAENAERPSQKSQDSGLSITNSQGRLRNSW